jgi:predicted transcriptional regulator
VLFDARPTLTNPQRLDEQRILMAKRPDGALEHEIMTVLWASPAALQPGDVNDRLSSKLAYTSVATVLGRLHDKGLVERAADGRAFTYRAAITESELAARRIDDVLDAASDRTGVLARFVGGLTKRDVAALQTLLKDLD